MSLMMRSLTSAWSDVRSQSSFELVPCVGPTSSVRKRTWTVSEALPSMSTASSPTTAARRVSVIALAVQLDLHVSPIVGYAGATSAG